ncbi:PTS sugar transporter subunit IIA [Temperatibacter marinus]|uniref:PTS sugar transporter subunit IIA n=1 Tax=Temperatibacter marinus TaxID=1456591 RepID=A0AA52EHG6_9PROT|nr:PTS sugar transporter subunit IIA [Temperatibacter marinus]WND03733.1 PTS sugar transporter subunit IIA [Temperatibacter marinus]
MSVLSLFTEETIFNPLKVRSKKQLLVKLSDLAAVKTGLKSSDIFQALIDREKLGSTALGHGVAIPHLSVKDCPSVSVFLAILDKPISFDAIDGQPIDVVVFLLAPEDKNGLHLRTMSKISRLLRDEDFCLRLRGAGDPAATLAVLFDREEQNKSFKLRA